MAKLRGLFRESFNFKTEYFLISSKHGGPALHKKLTDFCYEYDSPEDLAIVYFAEHIYEWMTKELDLAE